MQGHNLVYQSHLFGKHFILDATDITNMRYFYSLIFTYFQSEHMIRRGSNKPFLTSIKNVVLKPVSPPRINPHKIYQAVVSDLKEIFTLREKIIMFDTEKQMNERIYKVKPSDIRSPDDLFTRTIRIRRCPSECQCVWCEDLSKKPDSGWCVDESRSNCDYYDQSFNRFLKYDEALDCRSTLLYLLDIAMRVTHNFNSNGVFMSGSEQVQKKEIVKALSSAIKKLGEENYAKDLELIRRECMAIFPRRQGCNK